MLLRKPSLAPPGIPGRDLWWLAAGLYLACFRIVVVGIIGGVFVVLGVVVGGVVLVVIVLVVAVVG